MLLTFWSAFAALLLLISLAVHGLTFLGIDPMEAIPGVMWIHGLIFLPFIAALIYAEGAGGPKDQRQTKVMRHAPLWLKIITGVFFVYAFVNFTSFLILSEGGGPEMRDGGYVIASHGRIIRELTEQEYHQQQAYVVRGFSGHWMLFCSASLMFLVGAARLRSSQEPSIPETTEAAAPQKPKELPPEPTTPRAAFISLILYVGCVAMIFSGYPALNALCSVTTIACAVLAFRRRRGFPHRGSFESTTGCLTVVPNALLASRMADLVAQFIYVCVYGGPQAAATHRVSLMFPGMGPTKLSNDVLLDNRVWAALMTLVAFPLWVIGSIGLSYMAEQVGRFLEIRRSEHAKIDVDQH
jgi:hypothetical protein